MDYTPRLLITARTTNEIRKAAHGLPREQAAAMIFSHLILEAWVLFFDAEKVLEENGDEGPPWMDWEHGKCRVETAWKRVAAARAGIRNAIEKAAPGLITARTNEIRKAAHGLPREQAAAMIFSHLILEAWVLFFNAEKALEENGDEGPPWMDSEDAKCRVETDWKRVAAARAGIRNAIEKGARNMIKATDELRAYCSSEFSQYPAFRLLEEKISKLAAAFAELAARASSDSKTI
jgi:hypothetical protein